MISISAPSYFIVLPRYKRHSLHGYGIYIRRTLRLAPESLPNAPLTHINEYLYTEVENDLRKSGEKMFDYVDPKNRSVQIEMEAACTDHLKMIGGYLPPHFKPVRFDEQTFKRKPPLLSPVRNRVRTIEDAIRSVLRQEASSLST